MKSFLIFLAIGLVASDKLDRTYLPPPGAQFAGGNLGDIDAPLELPHPSHTGPGFGQIGGQGSQTNYGINGEPLNFGDKIPKVPTTTISYAFSQTTTYPPTEGYETTAFPINPVTGLPVQLDQANFPYGPTQGQQNIQNIPSYTQNQDAPNSGTNIQQGFAPQGPTSAPGTTSSPNYGQSGNQVFNQYPGQNVITPGSTVQIPGSVFQKPAQNKGLNQYPNEERYLNGQQELLLTGKPGYQTLNQYPGQNVINSGGTVQIPRGNQDFSQYPEGQVNTQQKGFLPSTASPQQMLINRQPGGNRYGLNYDGSQAQAPQGTYSGQPINVQNLGELQPTQSYQNQEPLNVGGISSQQYPTGNQNLVVSGPGGSENVYQPGSTPTIPSSYNGVPSTTPVPIYPSSTSAYSSSRGPVYRPERPQAAADRNAVILNYENVRTPNGYSYSFDTSNGIHADENGIVDNGTKAQGSYSYTGDDGKVYSVIYTADENGFQPRGDHLPTPPPIPEAIQRVIEQAARDKAAGIFDDGSYDEAKYGDKKYQGTGNRRRPQDGHIKPIVGLHEAEYDDGSSQDQLDNSRPVTGTRRRPNGKLPYKQSSNQIADKNGYQDFPGENRRVLGTGGKMGPYGDVDKNGRPLTGINQLNNFGTMKQGSAVGFPISGGDNVPFNGIEDSNQQNQFGPNGKGFVDPRPASGSVKDTQNKYPGSKVVEMSGFDDSEDKKIDIGNPSITNGLGKDMNTQFDTVTGTPLEGKRKQTSNQEPKGNSDSGKIQVSTQEGTDSTSVTDYINNAAKQPTSNQYGTQQDKNGYQYQSPNTEFNQNKFPTRFSPQESPSSSSTMKPDQRRTGYEQSTTRRPFITPNVYNQNGGSRQSTTRRPVTIVGVTSPTDSSYTDYDDGDDYGTDEDIDDENTVDPAGKVSTTSRPYQSKQTTTVPQYTPSGQKTSVTQKGFVTPGRRIENSGTMAPGYNFGSSTPMPSHNSRFGSNEATQIPQQRQPSASQPSDRGIFTDFGRPVTTQTPSASRPSDYDYQNIGPESKYPGANVVPGYSSNGTPSFGSVSSTPGSSTYTPTQGYSSTAVSPISGYDIESNSKFPPRSPGEAPNESFHTGYHYGPPKFGFPTTASPASERPGNGYFSPSGTPGVSQTSLPDTYQTTYQRGYNGFPGTSPTSSTSGRPGNFILSQPGTSTPEFQSNYQNGPSTPDYSSTIVSSTPGASPVFGYPGPSGILNPQQPAGFEYGTSRPIYPTTASPSKVGTSPGSFVSGSTPGTPAQGYSTTYRPGSQTTQDTNVSGPLVDGFGRPIPSDQGNSYPGFLGPAQGSSGPFYQGSGVTGPSTVSPSGNRRVDNSGPGYGGTESVNPGSYEETRIIGEDFSGPKQPQRFDPKTGYHY